MGFHVASEIFISPSNPALFIHFGMFFDPAPGIAYFPWQVNIPGCENIVVDQPVDCALADHNRIFVIGTDMVDRLPFVYEW